MYWKLDLTAALPAIQKSYSCWEFVSQEDITIPANLIKMVILHIRVCSFKFEINFETFKVCKPKLNRLFSTDDVILQLKTTHSPIGQLPKELLYVTWYTLSETVLFSIFH